MKRVFVSNWFSFDMDGIYYKLDKMWLEKIRAGVFLIIIIIDKHAVDVVPRMARWDRDVTLFVSKSRILAKVSRKPMPSLKEACQDVIRSRVKIPEKVEKLNLPKILKEELCTQCQWFDNTTQDALNMIKLID